MLGKEQPRVELHRAEQPRVELRRVALLWKFLLHTNNIDVCCHLIAALLKGSGLAFYKERKKARGGEPKH